MNARRAKVGWKSLCMPKEEGGLGLRLIKDFFFFFCIIKNLFPKRAMPQKTT